MITISRPPLANLPELQHWAKLSADATEELVAQSRLKLDFVFRPEVWDATSRTLLKLFRLKCAACESRDNVAVKHFRPLDRVVEDKSSRGYWWLAYDWNNIFVFCARCQQMQGSRFPIAGQRAQTPAHKLSEEKPLLLDPCVDNPNAHLAFVDNGTVVGLTERGRITIEIYGLRQPYPIHEDAAIERRWQALIFQTI
jgi:hypothetical protein